MLGKRVKKLLGQNIPIKEIAQMTGHNARECIEAYRKYMGLPIKSRTSDDLEMFIEMRESVHLYGETGVGKTYSVTQIAEKLGRPIVRCIARSEEDIVEKFGNKPFEVKDTVFVIEADNYYWRKYALIRDYIKESKSALVIITTAKDTPNKAVNKHLTKIKMFPPTRSEVYKFFKKYDPDFSYSKSECTKDLYSRDWREVWRNYLYGGDEFTEEVVEEISSKTLTYRLLKGIAEYSDFERCKHPLSFTLNWLGYNLQNFYSGDILRYNFNIVCWCDKYKYRYSQNYLRRALMQLIPTNHKGYLQFPPFQKKKKKKKKKKKYTITKGKKRTKKDVLDTYEKSKEQIGDFLSL